jgi:hypothetical protein
MADEPFVCIPVRTSLVAEWMSRLDAPERFARHMEGILEHWLVTEEDNPDCWGDAHAEKLAVRRAAGDSGQNYGPRSEGYQWLNVFLPNGTQLKMTYRGKTSFAEVRNKKIMFGGEDVSPSEFVSRVANNTSRNAWRDIWMKRPDDKDWVFSDDLRRRSIR